MVKLQAEVKTSDVGVMQIAVKRGRPGPWRAYKRKTKLRLAGSKVYVRVQDRAGNPSKWVKVKVRWAQRIKARHAAR